MQNCGRRPLNNGLSDLETFNLSKMGRACPRMSPRSSEFESYRKRHYQTRGPKKRGTKFELKSLTLPFTELTGPLRILGLAAVRPVRPAVRASRSISRSPDGRNADFADLRCTSVNVRFGNPSQNGPFWKAIKNKSKSKIGLHQLQCHRQRRLVSTILPF
jgi:hypothetical protein